MRKVFGIKKSPAEYVASCSRNLDTILDAKTTEEKKTKSFNKLENNLKDMTIMLYGDGETQVNDTKITKLLNEVKVSSLVTRLVMNIHDLGFEIPKTISKILCYWLHDEERANMAIDYFKVNTQLIPHLISHFEREEVYLPCSEVVKEALIHPELLKPFLPEKSDSDNIIFKVLNYVAMKDLAFSAEAYGMLDAIINCKLSKEHTISKDKETEHKKIVAKWLNSNYDGFWKKVHTFMEPNGSHLMIEQMLKLVYHILKNHRNYYVMIKYINDASNLTRIMRLLRVRNKKIQVMAFNVFKIFVANPQKDQSIIDILLPNREKIAKFFKTLGEDEELDGQFEDDLEVLNEQLGVLDKLKTDPKKDDAKANKKPESGMTGKEATKDTESGTKQTTKNKSEPTTSVPDSSKPKVDSTPSTSEGNTAKPEQNVTEAL
mmetsp:Transcript_33447/g.53912  ORF Transcript_33447/g.53912 Transcript_33447/m.53912 type:complete len:432 (-) Transcript_33447:44-1339(-)